MRFKTIASVLGLVLVLVLLPTTPSFGEFRGTDMWSNLAPYSSGRANAYPLSYYQLDYYVEGLSINFTGAHGDPVDNVIQTFAAFIFMLATFFMRTAISVFDWAFNVDVISGRHGVIGPVGSSTRHLYQSTFLPLVVTAVVLLGGWVIVKTVSRQFGHIGQGLVRTLIFAVIALAIIFNPGATIGRAASLFNDLGGAVASGTTGANGGEAVSDRLFDTFVYKPWAVLEFGGLKRCVSSHNDSGGFPRPVGTDAPDRAVCRDVFVQNGAGYGGYAGKFLRYPHGSDERKSIFEAIEKGEAPSDPHIVGWRVDKADAPAVDMMQGEASVQRLAYVCLLSLGIASAILLLGLICFAALFAQLGLMILLMATPVIAVAAMIPPAHGVCWTWLKWIGKLLLAKLTYAIVLSAALGVSAGLIALGGANGYLYAFGAQALLFLGLFLFRKRLAELTASRHDYHRSEQTAKTFASSAVAGAVGAMAAPVAAAGAVGAAGKARIAKQQAARNPDSKQESQSDPDHEHDYARDHTSGSGGVKLPADSSSPPASAGREYSPNPVEEPVAPSPSVEHATIPDDNHGGQERGGEPVPIRSFKEDYEQAREDKSQPYGEQRRVPVVPLEHRSPPQESLPKGTFAENLEQERAKTPGS